MMMMMMMMMMTTMLILLLMTMSTSVFNMTKMRMRLHRRHTARSCISGPCLERRPTLCAAGTTWC